MICGLKGTSSPLCCTSTLFLPVSNYGTEIFIVSAFYTWLLIASFPSTNYPLSSLMTHLIYLGNAPVKEVKVCPLAPASPTWRSAIKLSVVSEEKKQKQKHKQIQKKTKAGPSCFDVVIFVC